MAKVRLSPAIGGISGKVGNMLFRTIFDKQVVGRPPDFSHRLLSEKQVAQVGRFGDRGRNWKKLPLEVKAIYKARAKELKMPPCGLYQKTAAHAPVVQEVDIAAYAGQAGQSIRVRALDLVDVAEVRVIIRDGTSAELESGAGTRSADGDWVYTTTASAATTAGLTVEAIALNWAGQQGNRIQLLGASI